MLILLTGSMEEADLNLILLIAFVFILISSPGCFTPSNLYFVIRV
jgi:hypothetical protein